MTVSRGDFNGLCVAVCFKGGENIRKTHSCYYRIKTMSTSSHCLFFFKAFTLYVHDILGFYRLENIRDINFELGSFGVLSNF